MNLPHRRMAKRYAFDQNILATIRLEEHWPQVTSFSKDSFAYGRAFGDVLIKDAARLALFGIAFLPATARPSFPWPPVSAVSLAVDHAFTGDRDVLLFKRVDERRVAHQLHTFPAREHVGQILARVLAELDRGSSSQVKIDVALEMNCARKEVTGRHQHAATAGFIACRDRPGKSFAAISFAVCHGAKANDVEITLRKYRSLDPLEYLWHLGPAIVFRKERERERSEWMCRTHVTHKQRCRTAGNNRA